MSLLRKPYLIMSLLTAVLSVPLFVSCYDYDQKEEVMMDVSEKYINLRIAVSTGNQSITRAGEKPAGGENGDGREAGFERENTVSGVTVIFYRHADGINASATDAANTTIDFCAYYSVTLDSREAQGTDESPHKDEAIYSTGNRPLKGTPIDITKSYNILVVANVNLASQITAGTTTLAQVREMMSSWAYSGTGKGIDASNFIMASEEDDVKINFSATTPTLEGVDSYIYSFSGIRIERLAARIDFWTKYSYSAGVEYKAKTGTGTDVDGYEYKVYRNGTETTPTSDDIFKLVAVVPFNVNTGNEYFMKRTSELDNYTARNGSAETPLYLTHETTTSWVLDCYSLGLKTASAHPLRLGNTLTAVQALAEDDAKWLFVKDVQTADKKYGIDGADNIIVGYPMENTIDDNTPLYYYATGLAIYGYYYKGGIKDAAHTTKMVYYGYLRHQGESSSSYPAVEAADLSTTETIYSLGRPNMNYGIVRNNIYRISIDRITEKGTLELSIRVKKWDKFIHEVIYM